MPHDEAYYQAEKKIEQAQRIGMTELDLRPENWWHQSPHQLTELPESLGNLTQLQSLDLSYNQLTILPETLGNLTRLQSLNLSSNHLAMLPETLGNLTWLAILNLSANNLTTLPKSLSNLVQLQSLNLSFNNLKTLPDFIGQLTQLRSVDLAYNQLTAIPESLEQLVYLHTLNVPGNLLLKLPDSVGQLKELLLLILSKNNLTDLPPSIYKLEHLERLDLEDNPLNPELAAAYKLDLEGVKAYLRAKAKSQITINEAKLILVGEGEVEAPVQRVVLVRQVEGVRVPVEDAAHRHLREDALVKGLHGLRCLRAADLTVQDRQPVAARPEADAADRRRVDTHPSLPRK